MNNNGILDDEKLLQKLLEEMGENPAYIEKLEKEWGWRVK